MLATTEPTVRPDLNVWGAETRLTHFWSRSYAAVGLTCSTYTPGPDGNASEHIRRPCRVGRGRTALDQDQVLLRAFNVVSHRRSPAW